MNVQWVRKILFKIFSRWGNIAKLLGGYFLTASCIRSIVCSAPIHGTVDLKQDPNAGNSRVAECRSQTVPKHDFENFWSSEQHADSTKKLAGYGFLLVFYSDFRTNWNRCREILAVKVNGP